MASTCNTTKLETSFDVVRMLVGTLQNGVNGERFSSSLAAWQGQQELFDRCLRALDQAVAQLMVSEDDSDYLSWEGQVDSDPDAVRAVVLQAVCNECDPTLRG